MPAPARKAIFLDRDGTLNEDPGYLDDPSKLRLLPKVVPALQLLRDEGYVLVVVSNQSGVRRGLIAEGVLSKIHERLNDLLGEPRPMINHFRFCIHRPDEGCDCRKPKPKLLIDTAGALGLDLSRSFMVGDKFSDLVAGRSAGCLASVLVRTGEGRHTESLLKPGEADFVAEDLESAARWILRRASQHPRNAEP
jgi:histidinol-phosphate phosphatase family protein